MLQFQLQRPPSRSGAISAQMLTADAASLKKLNQLVWRIFTKGFGLTLQADAATFLVDKITGYSMNEAKMNEFLNYMAQNYTKISKDRSGMVSRTNIELVFNQVYQSQDYQSSKGKVGDVRKYVKVIDAFCTPKFDYDVHAKTFNRIQNDSSVLGEALDKVAVAHARFNLIKQRVLKQIRGGTLLGSLNSAGMVLSPIKSIKGIVALNTIRYVLGTISEMSEGAFSLEDPEDFIALDFSRLRSKPQDLIFEGSVVLVKCVCLGTRLQVESLIAPPAESRIETLSMLSHPDIMEATNFAQPVHELQILEKQADKARFVVISDVWLDQPQIFARFKTLFDGFNATGKLPELFILLGPFCSNSIKDGPRAWSHYQDLFDNFAEFIERIKNVRSSRFIFVPAASDPGFVESLLPRPAMPEIIFDSWKRANLDFVAASNPCRIVYFTQEIVIYRHELTSQLRKHGLKLEVRQAPTEELVEELSQDIAQSELDEALLQTPLESQILTQSQPLASIQLNEQQLTAKAVLDQASLAPLSLSNQPKLWTTHHALSLYPLPDTLILAERQESFSAIYEGCVCANPGSFPATSGSFLLFNPSQKTFDLCEMPKQ